ncbi:MAG TPA: DUF177 domain-containing protein [Polyangiaceae bacterium]|jgi:uncharacterized protein|nr:DUF177 domain-containing protein [Polyangiaceae bacterium]
MEPGLFSVNVSDIEREEQHRSWAIPTDWLEWALKDSEATPTGKSGQLTAALLKNGREFLVRGQIDVEVSLPCARTLEPAVYRLQPALFLLLGRQAGANEGPHRARAKARAATTEDTGLSDDEAAEDTFSGETLVLDRFVREQVLLELPMFPLRSDLRSGASPANGAAPQIPDRGAAVDPRLAPLRAIADRMREDQEAPEAAGPMNKKK